MSLAACGITPAQTYTDNYYLDAKDEIQRYAPIRARRFSPFVYAFHRVLDFGCGGGWMLQELSCQSRGGVDPIGAACDEARRNGITCWQTLEEVRDGEYDRIISHHTLEHVPDPLGALKTLRAKIRRHGRAIFVVPHETRRRGKRELDIEAWSATPDPNQHLFTWTPLTLANLFRWAGWEVLTVEWLKSTVLPEDAGRCCGISLGPLARFMGQPEIRIVAYAP